MNKKNLFCFSSTIASIMGSKKKYLSILWPHRHMARVDSSGNLSTKRPTSSSVRRNFFLKNKSSWNFFDFFFPTKWIINGLRKNISRFCDHTVTWRGWTGCNLSTKRPTSFSVGPKLSPWKPSTPEFYEFLTHLNYLHEMHCYGVARGARPCPYLVTFTIFEGFPQRSTVYSELAKRCRGRSLKVRVSVKERSWVYQG